MKKYLQKVKLAVKHPNWIFPYFRRKLFSTNLKRIAKVIKCEYSSLEFFSREFKKSKAFEELQSIERELVEMPRYKKIDTISFSLEDVSIIYSIVREKKPRVLIETGVGNGFSTYAILHAIELNNNGGKLFSIDLPNENTKIPGKTSKYIPNGKETGWIVPTSLKRSWNLVLQDAKDALPRLLKQVDKIEFFYHDSLHTYDHMLWEFKTVFPILKPNGIIVADDADWNPAFSEFCTSTGMPYYCDNLLGVCRKI